MENNKNSDLEKKEGRIDDLLRVLISLNFVPATMLACFLLFWENYVSSLEACQTCPLSVFARISASKKLIIALTRSPFAPHLFLCSAPGKLWSKEADWWTAEDAWTIQGALK